MKYRCSLVLSLALSLLFFDGVAKTAKTPVLGDGRQYYGTNYTLPFAHGYRAADALSVDRKEAIDRDVYHISRLGLNAFRLHLWEAEIADSVGNLISNDHLDLLDYLIAKMEERGIDVILTAQTNFGNGYPERNIDTGAFTYDYDKCDIHQNPAAIAAQERYIRQLVEHVNPYTRMSYASDPRILAIEINNEPCHNSSERQITQYINTMVRALRSGGWKKPILYNVSHNTPLVKGYYDADIDGTTYQWYPIGLVAGHERKGNFLPYVDAYDIPFANAKGFDDKIKVVYEFDPADMLDSYIFPAVARTFAGNGFQWATQFAYDPIDLARFNTEYQTHYLNLAYTPQKALGMRIARHAMEQNRDADVPKYPADTVFGDITVSYHRNLALLNSPSEYVYTNSNDVPPVAFDSLTSVAGYGSSPLVGYDGRGAYMFDLVVPGVWRFELMPDVLYSADPFSKPSLKDAKVHIINASNPIAVHLPGLGNDFYFKGINSGNVSSGQAHGATISVRPGTYLLADSKAAIDAVDPKARFGSFTLDEYVAPPAVEVPLYVTHTPAPVAPSGKPLTIRAEAFADVMPDSLVVYPADASFWSDRNTLYTMTKVGPYDYEAEIPASALKGRDSFSYRIVAFSSGKESAAVTYPSAVAGTPLDWDMPVTDLYSVKLIGQDEPLTLIDASDGLAAVELSTIPDSWSRTRFRGEKRSPQSADVIKVDILPGDDSLRIVLSDYVRPEILAMGPQYSPQKLAVRVGKTDLPSLTVNLVNTDGITYSADVSISSDATAYVDLSKFAVAPTLIVPAPYPSFLSREFMPEGYTKSLIPSDIERVQLVIDAFPSADSLDNEIIGVWLQ